MSNLNEIPTIVRKLDAQTRALARIQPGGVAAPSQAPEQFSDIAGIGDHRSELEALEAGGRLIKVEYPYRPRRRSQDSTSKIYRLIAQGADRYAALLEDMAKLEPFFKKIPVYSTSATDLVPRWNNGWFPGLDAISLYGLLAKYNPRRYVEVGSGNSTMFARRAIQDHGLRTSVVSIDPAPRANIDRICDQVVRMPCEDVPRDFWGSLSAEDILFVDNSHRSFQNSDVTVFFSEILPNLPAGLIYGIHDIFLPWDYPEDWEDRFYNEQYLLEAYLLGGAAGDEIMLANCFISCASADLIGLLQGTLESAQLNGIEKTGVAFWMRRASG